jgi:hypothetical protein
MPRIVSPEKPRASHQVQSKDVDRKHEIYHSIIANILEKLCEQLPRYYYKLTGDSEEQLATLFACDANTWTHILSLCGYWDGKNK